MIQPAAASANYSASCYRDILERMGVVLSFTKGVSMRPLIWQGRHYVAIQSIEGEPQIGDILLFEQIRRDKTCCILHRLIAIEGSTYITRGDNCLGVERINRADIIGRVSEIYKRESNWHISMDDPAYLRYVRIWNFLWPLRRLCYIFREKARQTAKRILIALRLYKPRS